MQSQASNGRRFLSKKSVAQRLNVHPGTIDRLVRANLFPRPLKFSDKGICRWAEDLVLAWENAQLAKVAGNRPVAGTAEQHLAA